MAAALKIIGEIIHTHRQFFQARKHLFESEYNLDMYFCVDLFAFFKHCAHLMDIALALSIPTHK